MLLDIRMELTVQLPPSLGWTSSGNNDGTELWPQDSALLGAGLQHLP